MFEGFIEKINIEKSNLKKATDIHKINTKNIIDEYESKLGDLLLSLLDKYRQGTEPSIRYSTDPTPGPFTGVYCFITGALNIKIADLNDFYKEILSFEKRVGDMFPKEFTISYFTNFTSYTEFKNIDELIKSLSERKSASYSNGVPMKHNGTNIHVKITPNK